MPQHGDQAPPRSREGAASARPFSRRWKWVELDELRRRGHRVPTYTLGDLIRRRWVEHDGNGRVRPTELLPDDLVRALSLIADPA